MHRLHGNINTLLPKATFTVSVDNSETQHVGVGLKGNQNLNVIKWVMGNAATAADMLRGFTFKLTLTNPDGTELGSTETFPWTKNVDGTTLATGTIASGGTFTLTNGQEVVIAGLPWGTTRKAVETDADGFVTPSIVSSYQRRRWAPSPQTTTHMPS